MHVVTCIRVTVKMNVPVRLICPDSIYTYPFITTRSTVYRLHILHSHHSTRLTGTQYTVRTERCAVRSGKFVPCTVRVYFIAQYILFAVCAFCSVQCTTSQSTKYKVQSTIITSQCINLYVYRLDLLRSRPDK